MEFKKDINDKLVRFVINPWIFKTVIEVDNETIHTSYEMTLYAIMYGILMLILGLFFGSYIGFYFSFPK